MNRWRVLVFTYLVSAMFSIVGGIEAAGAQEKSPLQSHDIEAGRQRIERRVTDQERKAVANRMKKTNPALAARIEENRAALVRARDARVEELKTRDITNANEGNGSRRAR